MESKKDFLLTKKIINQSLITSSKIDDYNYDSYGKVFAFTTEPIKSFYKKFDYSENVLAVASSGDLLLHSYLMNPKSITVFDINKLTEYYIALKISAIKNLSLEEFIYYFTDAGKIGYPSLDYSLFQKLEHSLEQKYLDYWNLVYEKYQMKDKIFQKGFFYLENDYTSCDYLNPKKYEQLKEQLTEEKHSFINKDILLLDEELTNQTFSTIFLSNIMDYIGDDDYFKEFMENRLGERLISGGKIMYNYSINEEKFSFKGKNYRKYKINDNEKIYVYVKK